MKKWSFQRQQLRFQKGSRYEHRRICTLNGVNYWVNTKAKLPVISITTFF
jgi:hypothetical protein